MTGFNTTDAVAIDGYTTDYPHIKFKWRTDRKTDWLQIGKATLFPLGNDQYMLVNRSTIKYFDCIDRAITSVMR